MKKNLLSSGRGIRGTLLLLFLFLSSFAILNAQVTVTGTVTGVEDDTPIPGVNIVEKGTSNGTITNADGTYSITVPSDAVLMFSFVGMVTQEVTVGAQTIIDIALSSSTTDLEEIVVIGYGTASKATLTGAVASVRGDELKQSPSTNFSNTLVGRVPGLFAYNRSGEPGYDGATLRIRGANTLGDNNPLVVVDGIPNGYHNWGNNVPLGELVDDYEMKDGTSFDWSNPAHQASPYTNREARFYATILYEGAQWRVRPSDVQAIDPWNRIQVGHVYDSAGELVVPGVDTRSGPIEDWNGGKSGYYVRKFVDPAIDPQYVKQDVPFRHFRYAEVLLNYAEACIELSEDVEALTYLNRIRKRAGQPDIVATGDALRQAYRHERRVEMAYEDQRFWDVRRWVIGPDAYHQTHAVDVRYETDQPATNYRQADGTTWGPPIFAEKELGGDARAWLDKAYFFPIMRDEMNKNSLLIQNRGY